MSLKAVFCVSTRERQIKNHHLLVLNVPATFEIYMIFRDKKKMLLCNNPKVLQVSDAFSLPLKASSHLKFSLKHFLGSNPNEKLTVHNCDDLSFR